MAETQKTVKLELPETDVRTLLYLLRVRQGECRRVTDIYPTHDKYRALEIELEKMKMRIANQMV